MKKVIKQKHLWRTTGLIAALAALIAVIFMFTRPTLAPDFGLDSSKFNTEPTPEGDNTFSSELLLPGIGEDVKADSYLVFNEKDGRIWAGKNQDTPVAIASLTKLMTAYVTQKYGRLTDLWAIPSNVKTDIRPVLGLQVGDRVFVKDLVNSMLIGSANDAASTLGAYISSLKNKPAIELMNQEAKNLGMTSTHYENPIGFDSEQNYSTARDLRLLLLTIRALPLFTDIDRQQSYSFTSETGQTYSVKATNTLLASDPEIHAIKTGYTDEAKGAMITAIHHNDSRFIIIVLGSPQREADTKLLKSQIIKQVSP